MKRLFAAPKSRNRSRHDNAPFKSTQNGTSYYYYLHFKGSLQREKVGYFLAL
jgi:hypothetical protein